jgi:hypothetical protein
MGKNQFAVQLNNNNSTYFPDRSWRDGMGMMWTGLIWLRIDTGGELL